MLPVCGVRTLWILCGFSASCPLLVTHCPISAGHTGWALCGITGSAPVLPPPRQSLPPFCPLTIIRCQATRLASFLSVLCFYSLLVAHCSLCRYFHTVPETAAPGWTVGVVARRFVKFQRTRNLKVHYALQFPA